MRSSDNQCPSSSLEVGPIIGVWEQHRGFKGKGLALGYVNTRLQEGLHVSLSLNPEAPEDDIVSPDRETEYSNKGYGVYAFQKLEFLRSKYNPHHCGVELYG